MLSSFYTAIQSSWFADLHNLEVKLNAKLSGTIFQFTWAVQEFDFPFPDESILFEHPYFWPPNKKNDKEIESRTHL